MQKYGRLFLAFSFGVLLLSLTLPALAIQLHGDWESSGDPIFTKPYTPKYDYKYLCQMEVSDGKSYPAPTGMMSKRYVVVRGTLDNSKTSIDTRNSKLYVVQASTESNNKDFLLQEPPPFDVADDVFWLSIHPGKTPSEDRVQVQVQASLKLGNQIVSETESKRFPRDREQFQIVAQQTSHNSDYTETYMKRVFVTCVKQQ